MDVPLLPSPNLITQAGALERLVSRLLRAPVVAVDTESNSLHAYFERVCLIQFSIPGQDYLVDPLALKDLAPLGEVFSSPKIEKVFHAAEYDLICLKRDFGFRFANLFDTMLAARILGWEEFGLGVLLGREFDIYADKRLQRANWGERPLPEELLSYAQLDTHFLIELRGRMSQELHEKGLWELASEDFRRLCLINERNEADHKQENNHRDPWRVRGANKLSPQELAVLAELCRYRDRQARQMSRPLFKVIGDRTLIAIAERCPAKAEELERAPGMTNRQMRRHGNGLLQAVQRGLLAEPIYPERPAKPDERYLERLERLRTWRKETARRMGVNSDVVLPRDLLNSLAEQPPRDWQALQALMSETPWRLKQFGNDILRALESNRK
jgi:ribonuclease D